MEQVKAEKSLGFVGVYGAEIFNAWRMGEIKQEDWYVMQAAEMIEQRLPSYRPVALPDMPEGARRYCEGRISESIPYDEPLARRLGLWFYDVQRMAIRNQENYSTLLWALERVSGANLTGLIAKVKPAIAEHEVSRVPAGLEMALMVKAKDAAEKVKGRG